MRSLSRSELSTLITCLGNFSVQYNFGSVSVALLLMSVVQCTSSEEDCKDGEQAPWVSSLATATVFIGSITGQLTMGYAGDVLGVDIAMGFALSLAAVSAIMSALLPFGRARDVYLIIIGCRFLMGIGLGGVFPLAAAKASGDAGKSGADAVECAKASARSFFWQVPGAMMPWIVALCLILTDISPNNKWRIVLGLGGIPATVVVILVYHEMGLEAEAKHQTRKDSFNVAQMQRGKDAVAASFRDHANWWKLLGTGGTWYHWKKFLYDICYYGVALFGGKILDDMSSDSDDISSNASIKNSSWKELVALSTGIPAVILSIYLMDIVSLKRLQNGGFALMAVAFLLMSLCFIPLRDGYPELLFVIYCFLLFTLSFGPNVTVFVLPASVFAYEIRSTMGGISAAMGKLGAVFGSYIFGALAEETSYPTVMLLCAGISLLGILLTQRFIEDDDDTLHHYTHVKSDTR